jgi:chromosome partitioning protein
MRVITIFNHKGGCGKTTTAINVAAAMADPKRRVLLVDLDPQAHATVGCGVREDEVELSTWHLMRGDQAADRPLGLPDVAWEIFEGFYLAPASGALATIEQTLAGVDGRESRLRQLVASAGDRYDVLVIDCGPSMGLLSVNALMAATEILIPVDLAFFSLYGLTRTLETIRLIGDRTGREPTVRILATMYDTRMRSMRRSLTAIRDQHGPMVLETVIRFSVALREAAAMGSPIVEFLPGSRGHEDYQALAQELLAAGLHLASEQQAREEAALARLQEQAVDEKIAMVYGATPIEGGVRFVCHVPGAKRVQVAGDFNQWNVANGDSEMAPAPEQPDVWVREFRLAPGRYAYRLILDGRWCSDPANPYVESNPYGELNSVVEVS